MDVTAVLQDLVAPFNTVALTAFGAPTTWGEVAGFVTGAWCVWLVARANVWNWPIGIANNVFFLMLFVAAGLYADGVLQIVYMGLAAYGWWAWLHGGDTGEELPVSRVTPRQWLVLAGAGVAGTLVVAGVLIRWTPSTVPWADAVTTVLSLLATWGQTRKKLESWWLWIAADVIYVPLYQYKGLTLTALLYLGFLALCVLGLVGWTRRLRAGSGSEAPDALAAGAR